MQKNKKRMWCRVVFKHPKSNMSKNRGAVVKVLTLIKKIFVVKYPVNGIGSSSSTMDCKNLNNIMIYLRLLQLRQFWIWKTLLNLSELLSGWKNQNNVGNEIWITDKDA